MDNVVVSEGDFLNSFSDFQLKQARNYTKAKKLFESTKNMSEVGRQVGVPTRTVIDWLNGNKSPICIKQIKFLKSKKLLPLVVSNGDNFILFLDIFAFIFGDGHLRPDLGCVLLSGDKSDLKVIKQKILLCWRLKCRLDSKPSFGVVKKVKSDGKIIVKRISGTSNSISINSSALSRLLFVAGAPRGGKVSSKVIIPQWIMNSDLSIKRRFLGVLFGNELQASSLRAKNAFTSIHLAFHKEIILKSDLENFLKQINQLLLDFGIITSKVNFENAYWLRKDNSFSSKGYIYFSSCPSNILALYNKIPILYASSKRAKIDRVVGKFIEELPDFKMDWNAYENAIELRKTGLGHFKIFKLLGLPKNYLFKLNSWIYYNTKPKYYDGRFEIIEASLKLKKGAKGML